jgi:5-methyltetrahydrofolate--homocysteine methyltransferase
MPGPDLLELCRTRTVLFDGALGTELMRRGLPLGAAPETWNLDRPESLREIHAAYYDAGADVATTNSFGASAIKLASHGIESGARELSVAAARLAASVRPVGRFVAGSLGPTGKFLKPQGESVGSEFERAFEVQAAALAEGGSDLLIIETMFDLREAACALRAAKRATALPVFVTMTYNRTKRGFFTLMGQGAASCAAELEALGAAAVGANCTLSSDGMIGLAMELKAATSLPIILQPNAGQPQIGPNGELLYAQSVEDYVRDVRAIISKGASFVGGCCGTTPEHIRALAASLAIR